MKATTCRQCREWVQLALFEGLPAAEAEAMENHLAECPECRQERSILESALAELRSFPEVPAPRHFYVYPEARRPSPWSLFGQLSPVWRAAAACLLVGVLAIGAAAASRLHIQSEDGVLKLAFGEIPQSPQFDPEQLKADLAGQIDAQLAARREQWLALVRDEIARSSEALTEQQKERMRQVAARLEERWEERQRLALLETEADMKSAALQIYQTLSREQRRQVALLNDRIDLLTVSGKIQGNQNDALMATLLRIADARSGGPGQ